MNRCCIWHSNRLFYIFVLFWQKQYLCISRPLSCTEFCDSREPVVLPRSEMRVSCSDTMPLTEQLTPLDTIRCVQLLYLYLFPVPACDKNVDSVMCTVVRHLFSSSHKIIFIPESCSSSHSFIFQRSHAILLAAIGRYTLSILSESVAHCDMHESQLKRRLSAEVQVNTKIKYKL
ncbi:unnamed protein product [Albugo candida]|uniref:Secreted protein n=1 Tax=Albugo candida TaxID=65357 RepID=A0A024FTW2_9STRA|nr:unnamed protein product [Albugo candida]|eukprot:CCI10377.1 unnamed protein product [Albugo candida]